MRKKEGFAVWKAVRQWFGDYRRYTYHWLVLLCVLTSGYGVALVYSANHFSGGGLRGWIIQPLAAAAGLMAALLISRIDYANLARLWPVFAVPAVGLMMLTYTPLGLNVTGTDDTAWLGFPIGSQNPWITFQPSELLKIVFILTFSYHLYTVREHISRLPTFLLLCLHGAFPALLVFLQGDDGTALMFLIIFLCMLLAAGLRTWYFLVGGVGLVAALPLVWKYFLDDYKRERFLCLFPSLVDKYKDGAGWQQYNGLKALGSGRLTGVGFLNGGSEHVYSRSADFIFTVAGEEFGYLGAVAVLVLLAAICIAIWRAAVKARDSLGFYICIGMMAYIGFQSIINIGMATRLLPVIGITLPFFSSGGSSIATLYLGIGLVLSVYYSSGARTPHTIFTHRS